ncbi:MAG: hypothetical protein FE78DRAFT_152297 [Acidomyces sp. 'richmondensis']|nr:MAG: hypothetical protein FE78DRAFT_152297 [Acidomyces sp. 'richmondensis']
MATQSPTVTVDTIALLEERLRAVAHLLRASNTQEDTDEYNAPASARARLHRLERTLASLSARHPVVADVLALQHEHPFLFRHHNPTPTTAATVILTHADVYTTSAAALAHLPQSQQQQEQQIPDPAGLASLLALAPRIQAAGERETRLRREAAELRARSAKLVEDWVEEGILGMGERWAAWEERLRGVEVGVRRAEAGRRRKEELGL